jgi:hypothetical protein
MKKDILILSILITLSFFASSVKADTIIDVASFSNMYLPSNSSFSFTHNILDNGYSMGTPIENAILNITFHDDAHDSWLESPWETASVTLNGWAWEGLFSVAPASNVNIGLNWIIEWQLESTGLLGVSITSTGIWPGDFIIGSSTLTVETAPVPEPANLLLLGTGLIGIGTAARRKIFKQ